MPAADKSLLGGRLGKYEIRSVLGCGEMGTVYEGWDPLIGRSGGRRRTCPLRPSWRAASGVQRSGGALAGEACGR